MNFRNIILALILTATIGGALSDDMPPDPVEIGNISYDGTGCPQGSVSVAFSEDFTRLYFSFDSLQVSAGPGVSVLDNRKSCSIGLSLVVPGGYSFTPAETTYAGYGRLDQGFTAQCQLNRYFSNNTAEQASSPARSARGRGGTEPLDPILPIVR